MLIIEFFKLYCRFLEIDLISSLTKGRNIKVIYEFYKVFLIITAKNPDMTTEDKNKAIKSLNLIISKYENNNNNISKLELCNKLDFNSIKSLYDIEMMIQEFNKANKIFRNKFDNKIFKQSIIEFNNALSHIIVGFTGDKTKFDKNINKANSHLHRGILDFYKTIIKKTNLNNTQIQELKQIREYEFNSIGLDTSSNKIKIELIDKYKNFVS